MVNNYANYFTIGFLTRPESITKHVRTTQTSKLLSSFQHRVLNESCNVTVLRIFALIMLLKFRGEQNRIETEKSNRNVSF